MKSPLSGYWSRCRHRSHWFGFRDCWRRQTCGGFCARHNDSCYYNCKGLEK